MRLKNGIIMLSFLGILLFSHNAEAFIFINEILADPPAGLSGDANGDGLTSSTQDEFVELLNNTNTFIDISGWLLKDALSTRHVFPSSTIMSPNQYLVVFGGGTPNLLGINWQIASSGTLSLNNTSETVSLFDASSSLIDQIVYGSIGGHDQSIVRWPEEPGSNFVLHSSIQEANGRKFSPGTNVNGEQPSANSSTVPEPITLIYGGVSLVLARFVRKRFN